MGIGSGAQPGRCGVSQKTILGRFSFRTCHIIALMGQVNIPAGKGQISGGKTPNLRASVKPAGKLQDWF